MSGLNAYHLVQIVFWSSQCKLDYETLKSVVLLRLPRYNYCYTKIDSGWEPTVVSKLSGKSWHFELYLEQQEAMTLFRWTKTAADGHVSVMVPHNDSHKASLSTSGHPPTRSFNTKEPRSLCALLTRKLFRCVSSVLPILLGGREVLWQGEERA